MPSTDRSRLRTGKLVAWAGVIGTVAALNYGARFSSHQAPRDALYQYSTAISDFVFYGIVLGLAIWISRGISRDELGLRPPERWGRAVLLLVGALILVFIVGGLLEPVLHGAREQGLEPRHWRPSKEAPFALNGVVIVLFGPAVEEFTFRGLGFALFLPLGSAAAIVLTAVAFGLWHGLVEALPTLVFFGLVVGFVRARTRSIVPGYLLHMLYNGIAIVAVLAH